MARSKSWHDGHNHGLARGNDMTNTQIADAVMALANDIDDYATTPDEDVAHDLSFTAGHIVGLAQRINL